jgi:hypothetical protein
MNHELKIKVESLITLNTDFTLGQPGMIPELFMLYGSSKHYTKNKPLFGGLGKKSHGSIYTSASLSSSYDFTSSVIPYIPLPQILNTRD